MPPAQSDRVETIAFHEWLKSIIEEGEAVLPTAPSSWSRNPRAILATVSSFARLEAMELAGTPLRPDEQVSLWAAEYLARACWELVSGEPEDTRPERTIAPPSCADAHFGADLFLRYLPKVLHRARALHRDGPLALRLEKILQQWPLTGVLAPGKAMPEGSLEFFGHTGLQQLYAERFFLDPHPAWLPREGTTREWIETIFAERGVPLPVIPEFPSTDPHE